MNVKIPAWVHRQLKATASLKGLTLAEYLIPSLTKIAQAEKKVPESR